jgi:hypothetical protein
MSAAIPEDCSHSVVITMPAAMPISRIKDIKSKSSVNGDLAALAKRPESHKPTSPLSIEESAICISGGAFAIAGKNERMRSVAIVLLGARPSVL